MKAVVLGGTHDHIRLIQLLKDYGYTVYLIDYYDNPIAKEFADYHIKGSTLDKDFVLSKCTELQVSLCIALCIDQALLTMAYVSEKLNLPCHISYSTAQALTNKILMKKKFLQNEIPTARAVFLHTTSNISESVVGLTFPLVVKPADANSSKGVVKVVDFVDLDGAVHGAFNFSNSKEVVVEEFKEGVELSVDIIISNFEPAFVMITENVKRFDTPTSFTIIKNVFDEVIHNTYSDKVKDIARLIAKAYGLKDSPLLIQLIAKDGELNVIEFSARIGGGSKHHFVKRITGFDILKSFLNIITKNEVSVSYQIRYPHASMNYVYVKPGIYNEHKGLNALKEEGVVEEFFEYRFKGAEIISSVASTDRPLGFMVAAQTKDELINKTVGVDQKMVVNNTDGDDIMIHGLY